MHLFFQSIGLIQQTALKIIILPFLCNYSTYSIKPLANTVHWSTKLTPTPMKRMIIWIYFISPAWLRVQSSFPLEKTREDNNRHREDSLMSNCLENKAQKDEKYCGYLIFLKKHNSISQKSVKLDIICLPPSHGNSCIILTICAQIYEEALWFPRQTLYLWRIWFCLLLTWQRRDKQPSASNITCNAISCSLAA